MREELCGVRDTGKSETTEDTSSFTKYYSTGVILSSSRALESSLLEGYLQATKLCCVQLGVMSTHEL